MRSGAEQVLLEEFYLGEWHVRPRAGVLQHDDRIEHLGPKPMEVLGVLAAASGRTVSREDIFDAVWGDQIIESGGLARSISEIRKTLGDNAREPAYIQTVPKRGYRVVAPVRSREESLPLSRERDEPMPSSRSALTIRFRWALTVLALVAVVWTAVGSLAPSTRRIGVLPPTVPEPSGQSAELATALAQVLPLSLSRAAGGEAEIVPLDGLPSTGAMVAWSRHVGRQEVDYLVAARVASENQFSRVSLSLRRVSDGAILWSQVLPIQLEDLSHFSEDAAQKIAAALDLGGSISSSKKVNSERVAIPAEAEFVRGVRLTQGNLDFDDLIEGIEELRDVIRQRPAFAPAYAALARAYLRLRAFPGDQVARARSAERAALRALELNPESVAARLALAEVDFFFRFDWSSAEVRLSEALEREPSNPDVLFQLAFLRSATGSHDEAIRLVREGQKWSPATHQTVWRLVYAHSLAGRHEQAVALAKAGLPERPIRSQQLAFILASELVLLDREVEALEIVNRLLLARGDPPAKTLTEFWHRFMVVLEERQALGLQVLSQIAILRLRLGDRDQALELAIEACQERAGWRVVFALVDPRFDSLRKMPGFERLRACLETPRVDVPFSLPDWRVETTLAVVK